MRHKKEIDHGSGYDWGQVSEEYAKYRDIYPPLFYQKITEMGLCLKGQAVLDLGTGTAFCRGICINMGQSLPG